MESVTIAVGESVGLNFGVLVEVKEGERVGLLYWVRRRHHKEGCQRRKGNGVGETI